MKYLLQLDIREDAKAQRKFQRSLQAETDWVKFVDNHAASYLRRCVVEREGVYYLVNPYEVLSLEQAPEEYTLYYISMVHFEKFNRANKNQKPIITTQVPLHKQKSIYEMIAIGGGMNVLFRELMTASPDSVKMFDSILPMLVGPLGGFAHYYTSQKRLRNILGRELREEEKSLLKKDAAALTFQIVASYAGTALGVEAAKLVLLSLNILPHTLLAHVCLAIGAGLGVAVFQTTTQLMSEYALHGRIISSPKEIALSFLGSFAFGMGMYAMGSIPFAGFLSGVIAPAFQRLANLLVGLVGIALVTLAVTRAVAVYKFLTDNQVPKAVLDASRDGFKDACDYVTKPPTNEAALRLSSAPSALFSHPDRSDHEATEDQANKVSSVPEASRKSPQ